MVRVQQTAESDAGPRAPRASIGLPVFNGMPFLPRAVESILAQTFDDLELVIADNASTDGSRDFCREVARRDPRVRLQLHPANLGAAPNYNCVFHLAKGKYFKWAAADDVCEPMFLEKCLQPLEADEAIVVSHSATRFIDASGEDLGLQDDHLRLSHDSAVRRFAVAVFQVRTATSVFGLIRRDALAKTGLIGAYPSSDLVLLAELAALGKFHRVAEPLFLKREHDGNSMRAYRTMRERAAWFATQGGSGHRCPRWRLIGEYARVVRRHFPALHDRAVCYACLGDLVRRMWPRMIKEAAGLPAEKRPRRAA